MFTGLRVSGVCSLCSAGRSRPPFRLLANTVTTRRADPTITTTTLIVPGCALMVTVQAETALTGEYEVDADGAVHFTLADEDGKHKEQLGGQR